MTKKFTLFMMVAFLFTITPNVYAMHIAEGFLPPTWAGVYFVIAAPFIIIGLKQVREKGGKSKDIKMLLGLVAAYAFILSAMKIPSVTGSCSHPTGTGLSAIIFGPFISSVVGIIVLLFQALLLAHGGLTTLGANTVSMGIAGPIVSYLIYIGLKNKNKKAAVFLAACLGDLTTYFVTAVQLSLAFPAQNGGVGAAFVKFFSIFSITQIPLAIVEGILTVVIFEFIEKYSAKEIQILSEVK
ncbi:cobalt/nickel transport system permease protein [Clostridium tetanomorphum]|uniref:Cobalt transport protein CbiM n=1 Tax=Clostridium tetanomorphum TaxID=1553 RepID=A0A923EC84_CLOTT|nr:energy-coupling factor ABC transporter permease [Clostridium tetanomorphum]KAJ50334.1 cobalt transport protein CbiM [Clostridium tetanomorphum DSM 665]MBC2397775.1 energy-coupling factor ABC transporter permease [Clostridium tetanomorphum]MBP1866053.1 cobalt/nickel transport system permease protein [Clostridium tetanomorphum]NRS83267.1 cobalt/nickel transport system permease protein [Clostridium tetanomorphum]NRZ96471.1 cobalt/nickel transport system permease protein [Clostridium tetanomorp